ncbi:MAG: TetR/AcrR family transcriptional regulator [Firmicutes bacterium]|nr:TetR/AcrR family transcriptional regulator [Bacillota bacterium]
MMTTRDYQAQQTKNRIYDAAILLMQTNGVKQTTIEGICKKAKVSIGSFYNYFKSKEDILFSIFESADRYFADVVVPDIYKLSGKEQLNRYFWHYGHYIAGRGLDFTRHLFFYSENKAFIDHQRYMHKLLSIILQQQMDEGLIESKLKVDELEEYLFIVARGVVYTWCLYEAKFDLTLRMQLLIDMTLDILYPKSLNETR